VLSVAAGFLLGERPGLITMTGIALAIPTAVLVSLGDDYDDDSCRPDPSGDRVWPTSRQWQTRMLSVVAGFGFGLFFVALSRTSADAGLLPLVGARVASITALAWVIRRFSNATRPVERRWWSVITLAGLLDVAANATYLVAVRQGSLSWVAAISSLYPVSTVLLARLVLDERLARAQLWGLGASGLALVLVGVGATG
jgi:uncharacterized membrane protein